MLWVRKILILEDDSPTAEVLTEYFTMSGMKVFVANTVDHALEITERERPGLFYVDVYLNGQTSFNFITAIRNIVPSAFIVLSSANNKVGTIVSQYPVNAWLPKPFSLHELERLIGHNA